MDPKVFLRDALKYAQDHNIDFNGYNTEYNTLRSGLLPLYKDCSLVGVVTADIDGHLHFQRTWRTSPRADNLRFFV